MVLDMVIWRRRYDALTLLGMILVLAPTAWLMAGQGREEKEEHADI
jgi:hypothetical protein